MAHAIVNCHDYNGYKNVLFMMGTDDFRYKEPKKWGYDHIHHGKYDRKARVFVANTGEQFEVYEDHSVKKI